MVYKQLGQFHLHDSRHLSTEGLNMSKDVEGGDMLVVQQVPG